MWPEHSVLLAQQPAIIVSIVSFLEFIKSIITESRFRIKVLLDRFLKLIGRRPIFKFLPFCFNFSQNTHLEQLESLNSILHKNTTEHFFTFSQKSE